MKIILLLFERSFIAYFCKCRPYIVYTIFHTFVILLLYIISSIIILLVLVLLASLIDVIWMFCNVRAKTGIGCGELVGLYGNYMNGKPVLEKSFNISVTCSLYFETWFAYMLLIRPLSPSVTSRDSTAVT
jgi:hypothetical protein